VTGGEHGMLDVLSVTRSVRPAILELKGNEDPVFLLQAGKYWLRIRRHLGQPDLARSGYFQGCSPANEPANGILGGPALQYHPTTGSLLRYLRPQMEAVRVGLADGWRRGLCVIRQ